MDHFYQDVEGWAAFAELYQVAVQKAPADRASVFVEVGSWLGRSAAFMSVEIINSGKPIELHCVDPWDDGGPDLRDTKYFKELKDTPFGLFTRNLLPVAGKVKLATHQMPSLQAAAMFPDQSIDFIMLDGDHNYEAIHADIEAWLPKMKPGSIMSGDDYLWPGVTRAADEQFGKRLRPVIKKASHDYRKSVAYWWVPIPQ